MSGSLERDQVVPLACVAYNFLQNDHSKGSAIFLVFGLDQAPALNTLVQSKVHYPSNDENIPSMEILKNINELTAINLQKGRQRLHSTLPISHPKLMTEALVLIKHHTTGPFDPMYVDDYGMVSIKRNKVEAIPASGDKAKKVHISYVECVLPADNVTSKLSDYTNFGHKSILQLNP